MGANSLPKTVTRQRRDYDLNPGPSAPESSTLTTRLPSQPRGPLYQQVIAPGAARRYAPADGSSTRGGSTSVRGRVRRPYTAKRHAASVPIS